MINIIEVVKRIDFWIYATMAVLFMIGITLCVLPVLRVNAAMKRARSELPKRRTDGKYIYDHPEFFRYKPLNRHWARFISNQNMMRANNAVCEVSDFINQQTAIYEPGHAVFGSMLPGMLTTLGILGSFYGIVTGLSRLDLSTSEAMAQSIAVLIGGMKTAFNTSIVGAVSALCFQLIRRLAVSSAERTVRSFVQDCQDQIVSQITPDATLMQILHAILTELRAIRSNR